LFVFGLDHFRYNSVRVISYSGLHQVNRSSGRFEFGSVYFGLWVTCKSTYTRKIIQGRINESNLGQNAIVEGKMTKALINVNEGLVSGTKRDVLRLK